MLFDVDESSSEMNERIILDLSDTYEELGVFLHQSTLEWVTGLMPNKAKFLICVRKVKNDSIISFILENKT